MAKRIVATALLLAGMAWLAQLSWGHPPTQALLRLSWRTEGQRVKHKLAVDPNLPQHMQMPGGNYEFRLIPYRLLVRVDGEVWVDRLVTPPGVHQDRPLMVFEEVALAPGAHEFQAEFSPAVATDEPPRKYALSGSHQLEAGRVLLLTLDPAGERLVWR